MQSVNKKKNYSILQKFAKALGLDLFGVADTTSIKQEFILPQDSIASFDKAVCLGIRLSASILSGIDKQPTKIYYHHYRTVNALLDQAALRLSNFIQDKSFRAMPIPASQILDWQEQKAHLSHKRIAWLAGLGWIGRNNLLVNKKLGSQLRLVSILTNMPLKTDTPVDSACGSCYNCLNACPAGAIKEDVSNFDHAGCFAKLKEFQKQHIVEQYICGVCVNACKNITR